MAQRNGGKNMTLDCEECGADLTDDNNVDHISASHSGDWVEIVLLCICGASYDYTAQIQHFERA